MLQTRRSNPEPPACRLSVLTPLGAASLLLLMRVVFVPPLPPLVLSAASSTAAAAAASPAAGPLPLLPRLLLPLPQLLAPHSDHFVRRQQPNACPLCSVRLGVRRAGGWGAAWKRIGSRQKAAAACPRASQRSCRRPLQERAGRAARRGHLRLTTMPHLHSRVASSDRPCCSRNCSRCPADPGARPCPPHAARTPHSVASGSGAHPTAPPPAPPAPAPRRAGRCAAHRPRASPADDGKHAMVCVRCGVVWVWGDVRWWCVHVCACVRMSACV